MESAVPSRTSDEDKRYSRYVENEKKNETGVDSLNSSLSKVLCFSQIHIQYMHFNLQSSRRVSFSRIYLQTCIMHINSFKVQQKVL